MSLRLALRFILTIFLSVSISGCGGAYEKRVDAFYYPDANDLTQLVRALDIGTVEACRDWASAQAASSGDPYMQRSTYECGIDPRKDQDMLPLTIYRETVQ
ncbi:hypothetical protein GCM10007148_08020 [Parvularcula lutaonensis]|nr:hypothetical protein GCM10007148_08020 [Parvularcula lutaonensis]